MQLVLDRHSYPKWPVFWPESLDAVHHCLQNDTWSRGNIIQTFENRFRDYCGCQKALLVNSGTEALRIVLDACGIGPGDEIILPGLTWPSTALSVLDCGATAVIVDIDPETLAISPEAVLSNISEKTKGIIAVHLYNSTADMDALANIALDKKLYLFEDAAQAHGGQWMNKQLGTLGDAGIFSFQQKKVMTCGEGGCIVTNNDDLFEMAHALRDHGKIWKTKKSRRCGGNSRISSVCAAVLITQLEKLPQIVNLEEKNGRRVSEEIDAVPGLKSLKRREQITRQSFYNFCFQVTDDSLLKRKTEMIKYLTHSLDIELGTTYPPLSEKAFFNPNLEKRYQGLCKFGHLPNCYEAYKRSIRFHHRYLLSPETKLDHIIDEIKVAVRDSGWVQA